MKEIITLSRINILRYNGVKSLIKSFAVYLIFIFPFSEGLRYVASEYGITANWGIIPVFLSDTFVSATLMIIIISKFSRLPLWDDNQMYILIRTDRSAFIWGQIIYIFFQSLIEIFLIITAFFTVMIPYFSFSLNKWDKLVKSISSNRDLFPPEKFYFVDISQVYIKYYSPSEAVIKSIFLFLLIVICTGLVIFLGNFIKRNLGTALGTIPVIMNLFLTFSWGVIIYYISPLSWLKFSNLKNTDSSVLPSYGLVVFFSISAIAITILIITQLIKKEKFNNEN